MLSLYNLNVFAIVINYNITKMFWYVVGRQQQIVSHVS